MAAPTDGGEPRARADDGSPRDYCPEWLTPAVEVGRRRAGIQTAFSRAVLSAVHQYINQRVTDGAWRSKRPRVVAVRAHGTVPAHGAVHRARQADGQAADAAGERGAVIGLGDQMHMVVLNTVVNDAEPTPRRSGQRSSDTREHARGPQAADDRPRAKGDVHGMAGVMGRARGVWDSGAAADGRLATGSSATSAPGSRGREGKLMQAPRHLDSADMVTG